MIDVETMNKYRPIIFGLIGSYLSSKKQAFDLEEADFRFLFSLSKAHKIGSLLYYALKFNDAFKDARIEKAFESLYASNLKKTILFETERSKVYEFLQANKIDFLPLKGIIMAGEYPEYGMREFADNDILFDKRYAKKVKTYFLGEGYKIEVYGEGAHDTYQRDPSLNFEMHRTLFDALDTNKASRKYFENILKECAIKDGYEHVLSDEEYYIYFIAHTYKHFAGGGCGIRTLVDTYLYLKHHVLNRETVDQELTKLGLLDFERSFASLSFKTLEQKELGKEEGEMLLYIISSGAYGTLSNHVKNGLKNQSKAKYIIRRIFPPLSFYKNNHPIAYYSIIGIPFVWLRRLLRAVFVRRKNINKELEAIKEHK